MPHKRSLPVCVMLCPFRFTQNHLRPTPTIVRSKATPRSAPSSHSKASADCSIYGSSHRCGRQGPCLRKDATDAET